MFKYIAWILVICLLAAALTGCSLLPGAGKRADARLVRGEYLPEDCTALKLECSVAEVVIGPGTEWRVEYALHETPEIALKDGTLTITEPDWQNAPLSFPKGSARTPYVTITVPAEKLDQVTVENGVGDLKICNLDFGALTVVLGVGDLHLEGLIVDSLSTDVGTGDTVLREVSVTDAADLSSGVGSLSAARVTAQTVAASCGTGDLTLEDVDAGAITVDSGTGDVELRLSGTAADYAMELDSGLGEVEVDDAKQDTHYVTEGGAKTLRASTGIGEVEVEFAG